MSIHILMARTRKKKPLTPAGRTARIVILSILAFFILLLAAYIVIRWLRTRRQVKEAAKEEQRRADEYDQRTYSPSSYSITPSQSVPQPLTDIQNSPTSTNMTVPVHELGGTQIQPRALAGTEKSMVDKYA
jgi:flagellar biosynthesis/type III secretory pathway M-ring protein FliF/YscJ